MDPTEFKAFLSKDVQRVLPHLTNDVIEEVTEFLIFEGCKKERDLRIMTIPLLETHLDLVDASDLYSEWQTMYGSNQPSTSSGLGAPSTSSARVEIPSTSRRAFSEKQLEKQVTEAHFQMPTFDKDSPYIPARVKSAIVEMKRPTPRDREEMVSRIVDHCRDTVPNLQRNMFNRVADSLVSMYPDSFKDTLQVTPLGSESLRSQMKNKFDNDKRPSKFSLKEKESPNTPSAYGCISWSPELPDGESEESQLNKKKLLQDMFKLSKKQWDWKIIKSHIDATFYLQRKDINGPEAPAPSKPRNKRKRNSDQVEEAQADQPTKMFVSQLTGEWPFIFKVRGLNYHFRNLTGVDLKEKLNKYIQEDGPVLIDFLACKDEQQARLRRKMNRAAAKSCKSPTASAVIQMLLAYFKEDLNAMITFVEETTSFQDVHNVAQHPDDGTPSIIVAGKNLFSANDYFVSVDQQVVTSASSVEDALTLVFGFYFMLNLQYSSKVECTLTFIQRAIAKINPAQGTKGGGIAAAQRKIHQKVLKLSNGLADFKQKLGDESAEENQENVDEDDL